jgi:dihydroneopterin aldolase
MDVIIIKGLKIEAPVGVTAAERDNPQRLEVDAVITPLETFAAVADEIDRTVDY